MNRYKHLWPGVYRFAVTVQHDNGKIRFLTMTTTPEEARTQVYNAENCPLSAIKKMQCLPAVTRKRAQVIAAQWHGGQWSALYSFASTGQYLPELHDQYLKEIDTDICERFTSPKHSKELYHLQTYFLSRKPLTT